MVMEEMRAIDAPDLDLADALLVTAASALITVGIGLIIMGC
jgi:hypothetical protein